MKILFVSDFHHLNNYQHVDDGYKAVFNNMDNTLITLKDILINNEYDLLVIGGDLCEDGDVNDYQSVKNTIDKYNKKPYLITLGNHDIKENFYQVFTDQNNDDTKHYTMEFNNYKLISFDSSVHDVDNGFITSEDSSWLIREIENSEKEVILLTHHHILPYQHETKSVNISDKLLSTLKSEPVKLVLTGHTHTPFLQKFDFTQFVSTGSLSFRAHKANNKLIFDNERYYTIIDVKNFVSVKHINIKDKYKQFKTFDLNK